MELLIKDAIKIEKKLGITLTKLIDDEEFDDSEVDYTSSSSDGYTLGDVFFTRKKKK